MPRPLRPALPRPRRVHPRLLLATLLALLSGCAGAPPAAPGIDEAETASGPPSPAGEIALSPCTSGPRGDLCGTLEVHENREEARGRKIPLNVRVIPATREPAKPDPVFMLAGGPGQAATKFSGWIRNLWVRDPARDLVLVDQRGTGGSNRLDCEVMAGEADPLAVVGALFEDPAPFRACLADLEKKADLRFYTTPLAMDDLDDVRRALGYGRINIVGGSYGSRAGLIYLRRHGEHVRAAVLWAPSPLALINPLYHAGEAQRALDLILDRCAAEPACGKAFPGIRGEVEATLARLEREPARIPGDAGDIILTRDAFAEALRVMLYTTEGVRDVPRLLHQAGQGNFGPIVEAGAEGVRGILEQIDVGMLLSVVCSEEFPRIDMSRVEDLTRGTFLGDTRLRTQAKICAFWPRGSVPAGYGEPVRTDVPVLVISGTMDPVTPPRWGEEIARHMPRGHHVVVPRAHDVNSPCVAEFAGEFLHGDPTKRPDTSCVEEMKAPPFRIDG